MNATTASQYVVRYTFHGQPRESVRFDTRREANASLKALANLGHYGKVGRA